MRKLLLLLSLAGGMAFSQPYAVPLPPPSPDPVTTTTTTTTTAPVPQPQVVCPEGCVPKKKPKPKPKPKPAPKPAPAPKPEPRAKCEPIERVIEKKIYVDREVSTPPQKHSLYFLLGRGMGGLLTDHYSTRDRNGEFAIRNGTMGAIGTIMYDYKFLDSWSAAGSVSSTLPKPTWQGGVGFHW